MTDTQTNADLSAWTLATMSTSIDALREEAWNMTKAMDVRLEAFQRNVEKSNGSDLGALSNEAIRIAAYARRAFDAGRVEPSVVDYTNTSALLDPRGYEEAMMNGTGRDFRYDPARVVVSAADREVIETPRPLVQSRGPADVDVMVPARPKGAER